MALIKFGNNPDSSRNFTMVPSPDRRGGYFIRTGTNMGGDSFMGGVGTGVGIGVGILALAAAVAFLRGKHIA